VSLTQPAEMRALVIIDLTHPQAFHPTSLENRPASAKRPASQRGLARH
jgi:hypothetical protein